MTRATLFERLRNVVPRVSVVDYQKPNKGYVRIGTVYEASVTWLFRCTNCMRRDGDQLAELVHAMDWLGFNDVGQDSWTAVRLRKRGNMFNSGREKKLYRKRQGHKAVLRFRFKKYASELKELGDES